MVSMRTAIRGSIVFMFVGLALSPISRAEVNGDPLTTSTVTTRFGLDGWNPAKEDPVGTENFAVWADMDGSNHLTMRCIPGDAVDQIFAREDLSGTVAWYLLDRLGSVRDRTYSSGAQKHLIDYDGWGNVISETSPTFRDRYKWVGRDFDAATGLQYNRERFYDATAGRWISQDASGCDAGDSKLNRNVANQGANATNPPEEMSKTLIPLSLVLEDIAQQWRTELKRQHPELILPGGANDLQSWLKKNWHQWNENGRLRAELAQFAILETIVSVTKSEIELSAKDYLGTVKMGKDNVPARLFSKVNDPKLNPHGKNLVKLTFGPFSGEYEYKIAKVSWGAGDGPYLTRAPKGAKNLGSEAEYFDREDHEIHVEIEFSERIDVHLFGEGKLPACYAGTTRRDFALIARFEIKYDAKGRRSLRPIMKRK
jgi:RHS repeat-associated protein